MDLRVKTIVVTIKDTICFFHCMKICTDDTKALEGELLMPWYESRQWYQAVLVAFI